jgi:hypothetical protein
LASDRFSRTDPTPRNAGGADNGIRISLASKTPINDAINGAATTAGESEAFGSEEGFVQSDDDGRTLIFLGAFANNCLTGTLNLGEGKGIDVSTGAVVRLYKALPPDSHGRRGENCRPTR